MHLVTKTVDKSKDSCWLNLNYRFKTAIKNVFGLLQTCFSFFKELLFTVDWIKKINWNINMIIHFYKPKTELYPDSLNIKVVIQRAWVPSAPSRWPSRVIKIIFLKLQLSKSNPFCASRNYCPNAHLHVLLRNVVQQRKCWLLGEIILIFSVHMLCYS